jgi:hypothetical protein
LKREFCYFKQPTPTFLSAISAIMFHAKASQTHDIPTKLRYWIPWTWKGHVVPAKNKYADSKSSAYLRGTWLKTKKYQTVILAYLRYVSTRIIAPWTHHRCLWCYSECISSIHNAGKLGKYAWPRWEYRRN